MAGFLDPQAPSIEAEYARYIDILGKILLKNFLISRIGLDPTCLEMPLGSHGERGPRWRPHDARLRLLDRVVTIEVKCSRVLELEWNHPSDSWAFGRLLHTQGGRQHTYDVLLAFGIPDFSFNDTTHWSRAAETRPFLPHEPQYLDRCGIFFYTRKTLDRNFFRVSLARLPESVRWPRFSWGRDRTRCLGLWAQVLAESLPATSPQ